MDPVKKTELEKEKDISIEKKNERESEPQKMIK